MTVGDVQYISRKLLDAIALWDKGRLAHLGNANVPTGELTLERDQLLLASACQVLTLARSLSQTGAITYNVRATNRLLSLLIELGIDAAWKRIASNEPVTIAGDRFECYLAYIQASIENGDYNSEVGLAMLLLTQELYNDFVTGCSQYPTWETMPL